MEIKGICWHCMFSGDRTYEDTHGVFVEDVIRNRQSKQRENGDIVSHFVIKWDDIENGYIVVENWK